jgi:hypothetical protein
MDKRERIRRPDPERTEPKRDSAAYFFNAVTGSRPKSKQSRNGAENPDNAVAHGVRLGYQVVEEQIREGQRLAERLRQAADLKGVTESEGLGPLVGRALHLYKDLGALCVDAVEALVRSPALLSRALQSKTEIEQPFDAGLHEVCAVEISSSHRTQVTLKLARLSRTSLPHVHALHAHDPAIPSLTNVRFSMEHATGIAMLHVDIPDKQYPATYTGVVVDRGTNEPCGTVCIRVIP